VEDIGLRIQGGAWGDHAPRAGAPRGIASNGYAGSGGYGGNGSSGGHGGYGAYGGYGGSVPPKASASTPALPPDPEVGAEEDEGELYPL